jgi:hypothetical protein
MSFSRSLCPDNIVFISLGLFLLLGPSFSRALAVEGPRQGDVLAIGNAPVVQGNAAAARKAAITEALLKGVEDHIVHLLGSREAVRHFERVTEEIIPAAREEVGNFQVLAEQQVNGRYKVLLRLRVNEESIRERLRSAGIALTDISPIKVLFLVSESIDGELFYWWKDMDISGSMRPAELTLHKVFQDRGFYPINRTLGPPEREPVDGLTSPDLQDNEILKLGKLFAADVVIFGSCTVSRGKEITLTLKAVDVSQGIPLCKESVAEVMEKGSGDPQSLIKSVEGVVNRLAAALCPCINGSVAGDAGKIHSITVTLARMKMPKEFWRFSDFLTEEVMGVTSVIPSEIKDTAMSATVEFQGERVTFINRVLTHPKRPFPLRLDQTEHKAIVFNLE